MQQATSPEPVGEPLPQFVSEPQLSVDQQRAAGDVVRVSPLAGSEIPVAKVPGAVSTVSADAISNAGTNEPQDVLQKEVPGIILGDAGGNDLRQQVDYRGFGSGSVNGFPQGLAVYQNGVRINEVFGDTVNWDVLPKNAISDMTVMSGNPIFGLNAIGGAISVVLNDGFSYQGGEVDVMFGSFGRKQVGVQAGAQSGPIAAYFAGELIEEDGWRDFSPAEAKRAYMDIGAKGSRVEAHINLTIADTFAGATAATPVELLARDKAYTFTSPQTTDIEVVMPSFNVAVKVTDTLTVSGLGYYRDFKSRVIDGNNTELDRCDETAPGSGVFVENDATGAFLCAEEDGDLEGLENSDGDLITAFAGDGPYGVLDRINTDSESFGFALQAVEKRALFGHNNHFVAGISYDRGRVDYGTSSELGTIGARYVVTGSGQIIEEPEDFAPRAVDVTTNYYGVYFLNAFDVNDEFTLTLGGRYNYAKVDLVNVSGNDAFDGITSEHDFNRFNPTIGGTYKLTPGITLYGGYAESNRAPTPAELACANPENECPIESFLTDDPPLDQVVTKSFELGVRGQMRSHDGQQRLDWGLGLFHATNNDDIIFVASETSGRGYFFNAGDTLRRGLEASLRYKYGPLSMYASYSYIKATYEDAFELSSPAHPDAGLCADGVSDICVPVMPGDSIPGIPNHRFKAGFDYYVTSQWKVGADLIAASGQHYFGDDANLLGKLGGYTRVDLSTSYDVTDNIQLYAFANNIFDTRYGVFGTLFEADEAPAVDPENITFTNPRSKVLAAPAAFYGGVKVKF